MMMVSQQPSTDDTDTLLLTAVKNGDLSTTQSCLLSVPDPNVYLNRVYDQPHDQKCTLLMIACLNGHENIVSMILRHFKPNLEVHNHISLKLTRRKTKTYNNVTVLWGVAATNRFPIVQLLIDYGANINCRTSDDSTPVRCACYNGNVDMLRYLIAKGADASIINEHNDKHLFSSIKRKHAQMTAYLVDELRCNVDITDENGCSPLYVAVDCKSLEIVQFLLKHGARNFPARYDQRSPLMLAAEKRCTALVKAILPYCSLAEQIEAEELLGSSFACVEYGPCDLQQSHEYYRRAMQLRLDHNLPKTIMFSPKEVFNNRHECETLDELEEIRQNPEDMYIEALLVRERLLSAESEEYHHSVRSRGVTFAQHGQFDQAIALWLHELEMCRQYSISVAPESLRYFVSVFCEMIRTSTSISIETLLIVITTAVKEIQVNSETKDRNLHTLLFLTTIISKLSNHGLLSASDLKRVSKRLYSIHQGQFVTCNDRSTLLHLALSDRTSASDPLIDTVCKYPCLSTSRILLESDAGVNARDAKQNTPLHILAANSGTHNEILFELLCDAGAHLDYVNTQRQTPIDIVTDSKIKQLLQTRMELRLKCVCARLIQENGISFHETLPTSLKNFVDKH